MTTEGITVEQETGGPGPMSAELPGPAPTQVEEGQAPEVEAGKEGRPESPQPDVPPRVSTSTSLPDLTCYSEFGDDLAPTDSDADSDNLEATVTHTPPATTQTLQDTSLILLYPPVDNQIQIPSII